MLKLGIHMDNKLLYCGIENRTPFSYSSLYLSIFLSFTAKFVSHFSPELCKLESLNMVYILFFYFYPFFFLSPNYKLTLKILVRVFSKIFKARMLILCAHMDNE